MSKKLFLSMALVGFTATGLALSNLPAPAADETKTIDIVRNEDGKFVFSEPDAQINEGQSITWVSADADVPHQLVPDSDADAFTDTGAFDASSPPTQTFNAAGTINYHCSIHPKSMKGSITVAAAEAPAEESKPAPRKRQPSYGY
jgi:plastocyanin